MNSLARDWSLRCFASFKSVVRLVVAGLALAGSAASLSAQADAAKVRHAPSINGSVQGSVQQMLAESVTFNSGANVTGNLYVIGSPTVQLNGSPTYGGTQDGTGTATPTSYSITLNSAASLAHVVRRTNAATWPTIATVPSPSASASVTVTSASQSVNWSTARNVTLNSGVGQFAVPAGTYGDFIANNNSGFTLGVAGATTPAVYNFQNLTLNSISKLVVVGPVTINLANGFSANSTVGDSAHPAWLTLNIRSGGYTLNSACNTYGYVLAPSGTVIINNGTQLVGGVTSDYLTVNGGGLLKLQASSSPNQAPTVALTAPANGSTYTAPATITLNATASDSDGSITKVEFYRGTTKLGEDTSAPYSLNLTSVAAGSYSYFARATDNSGATTDSAAVTVTVSNPNQPPTVTLTAPADGTPFTAPASFTVSATASDSDGTIARVDFYRNGTLFATATAAPYQVTAGPLAAGSYAFSATAVDNSGAATSSATATITVLNPNQAPTVSITAPADNTTYDDPAAFTLTATAADSDGTVAKVEFFKDGTKIGEDLTAPYQFAVSALPIGTYHFLARATDNLGSSTDSAAVKITVVHINDAPTALGQSPSTLEDTPLTVTLSGVDPDGDPLGYTVVTYPMHGALSGLAPNLVYTPAADFNGSDSFTFRVNDGSLQSAPATVAITVVPVNDAPVADAQSATLDEDSNATITLTGSDIDSTGLTFTYHQPAHGVASGTAPNVVYTPAANYYGSDSFTYQAFDGAATSTPATVTLTVLPKNDAPVAVPASITVTENGSTAITLVGTDIDGDSLTYTVVANPTHGSLSGTGPNRVYTPATGYSGPDSFTFKVADNEVSSAVATISLNVTPLTNHPPVASAQSVTTAEDTTVTITLTGSDQENDSLQFSILTQPEHGTLIPGANSAVWTYTPAFNYHDGDSFTFKASDNLTDSAPATVTLTVTSVNDAPVAVDQTVAATEDTPVTFDLLAADVDGDLIEYLEVTGTTHGTLTPVTTAPGQPLRFTYTPALNYDAADSFTYRVTDGTLQSGVATVTIQLTPVNDAPVATTAPVTLAEDTIASIALTASDPDSTILNFTVLTNPTHGTLAPGANSSLWTYTPAANYNGPDDFTYSVSDGALSSGVAHVALTITPVNDVPEVSPVPVQTLEDTALPITLTGTDVDGDALTINTTQPAHGTVTPSGSHFIYTPAANYNGPDAFTYTATDGTATSLPATVTITVIAVNDAPVALAQNVTTDEDVPAEIQLHGSDVDGDSLSYTILDHPSHGTLAIGATPGKFTYHPAADYNGTDTFTFKVNDDQIDSGPATVTITLNPVNDAPVAASFPVATNEDVPVDFVLAGSDVDGDTLSFERLTEPAHGTLSGTAPNLTYTPEANYHGSDSFTYRVADAALNSNIATVSFDIASVNDAPVATAQALTLAEDTPLPLVLTGTDVDGDTLTFTHTDPAHGHLSGTSPNFTYTPNADYNGSDSFTFQAYDGALTSAPATVTLTITPVNDKPVANAQTYGTLPGATVNITLTGSDVDGDPITSYTVLSQPTHGTLTGTPPNLTYVSVPDFAGEDTFSFRVSDGFLNSDPAQIKITTQLQPRSRTYTTTEDFQSGALVSLKTDTPDELSNTVVLSSFDAVWIANSSRGTVIKIDPDTGRVLGEYRTKPIGSNEPYPSRVAVDSKGNAWVANMSHNSIVKIGLPENGYWVDRNGDGQIQTSGAFGDLLDWDGDDVNAAKDEAILLYVRTDVPGVKQLTIDKDDNVWVGAPNGNWQLFNGRTGALMRTEPSTGTGGQGGFIAFDGKMYSAGSEFLVWDTNSPIAPLPQSEAVRQGAWASARDSQGNLWVTKDWTSTVTKYAPNGTLLGEYYHGEPWAMGIAIDANDHVWVAHSHCGHSVGHLLPDGSLVGNVEVTNHGPVEVSIDRRGRIWVASSTGIVDCIDPQAGLRQGPENTPVGKVAFSTGNLGGALWTYGRFTASTAGMISPDGTWTFVYDGQLQGTTWGALTWDALLSNDSKVQVDAALSSDGVTYGTFQPLTFSQSTPSGAGRFLKVRTRLVSATTGESPVLRDLTVGTAGYTPPTIPYFWDVSAGADIAGNWPDAIQLKGAFQHSPHDFLTQPTYEWSIVSTPPGGDVAFSDAHALRPKANFTLKGDYVLRLTATLDGVTHTDDVALSLTPYNRAPSANAGYTTFRADMPSEIWLWGEVRDDGLPVGAPVTSHWSKLFGPGDVSFADPSAPTTKASFTARGVYVLQLEATDGELTSKDVTTVWLNYPCIPVAPAGLMSWWQASGNGDDHVGGNQAFTSGGASYAEGRLGGAFHFDGDNDRVRIFSAPSLDVGKGDGFTMEFWANPNSSRTSTMIEYSIGLQRGVSLRQTGTGLSVDFKDTNGTSHILGANNALPVGVWTHVAASYDRGSGEARVYINGQLQATSQIGSLTLATNYDLNFGGQPSLVESYEGLLDEISVYDRALFADEISTIASNEAGKRPPVSNVAPVVDVGPVLYANPNVPTALNATVTDDGQPDNRLNSHWTQVSGPGVVVFADPTSAQTTATFPASGAYTLQLKADDGAFCTDALLEVRVGALYKYDTGLEVSAWWTGNDTDLDAVHQLKLERFNGLAYGAGHASNGFAFDGNDDYGSVAANAATDIGSSAAGMTIELWAKPTLSGDRFLLDWGIPGTDSAVSLQHGNGGPTLVVNLMDTGGGSHPMLVGNFFATGTWVHLVLTYDRTTGVGRIYKNGELAAEANLGIFRPRTNRRVFIGRYHDGGGLYNGTLDELTFYSRPLALAEVQAIYQGDITGKVNLDNNTPPVISAGPDRLDVQPGAVVTLAGTVTDDGRPAGHALAISWSQLQGPGTAVFANPNAAATTATFTAPGTYVLQLSANDGLNQGTPDTMVVRVGITGSVEPDSSLAAWWPANGEVHEVVHGNHDVEFLPRGPVFDTGKVGEGFLFNGSDHFGRVPASTDFDVGNSAAGMSIELWAKPTLSGDNFLLDWGVPATNNGVSLQHGNGGPTLLAHLIDSNGGDHTMIATGFFSTGTWVHLVVTYDRVTGVGRIYKNGELVTENSIGVYRMRTNTMLFLGQHHDGGARYNGVLDELSLYNKPLSLADVRALYAAGANGKAPLDDNLPPVVSAGPDVSDLNPTAVVALNGTVTDDGRPVGYPLAIQWSQVEGPGTANFADATSAATTATFTAPGTYVLRLDARDAQHVATPDTMVVRVGITGSVAPDSTLAAWWPANGEVHEVVHGNHDVEFLPRGPVFDTGKVGEGFLFNGSDHFGRVPASTDFDVGNSAAGMSIELWAKPTLSGDNFLLDWGVPATNNGVSLQHGNGGPTLLAHLIDSNGGDHTMIATGFFSTGTWVHLVVTYDRTTGFGRIYKNGELVTENNIGVYRMRTSTMLFLGQHHDGGARYKGVLDELSLYNKPLSLSEVQALYAAGASGKAPLDDNLPPVVSAGPDVSDLNPNAAVALNGTVTDDGRPVGYPLVIQWSQVEGPGTANFANAASATTTATFTVPGTYVLRLDARDAQHTATPDTMVVRVGITGSVEPDGSLAAWWPANGEVHEVVHGNHDVEFLPRGPLFDTGKVGEGFLFNGSDHFGRVPASADFDVGDSAAGMSIELWAKPTLSGDSFLLDWGVPATNNGVSLQHGNGGPTLLAHLIDSNGGDHTMIATGFFSTGTWVHLVVTYDRTTGFGRIYKNGELVTENNIGVYRMRTSTMLFLGQHHDGGARYKGVLDELSLYNKPLSLSEVQALYAAGASGKAPLDDNLPPVVSAGPDVSDLNPNAAVALNGTVTDDGRPVGYPLVIQWSQVEGPGTANFANAASATTTATFTVPGTYVLRLDARDAQHAAIPDTMVVRVGVTGSVAPDGSLAAWWPANGEVHEVVHGNHDVEFLPRGPVFSAGKVGEGFQFSGGDYFGRIPASADFDVGNSAAGMSIELWAKPTLVGDNFLLDWGVPATNNGVSLQHGNGGPTLLAHLTDINGGDHLMIAGGFFASDTWVHLVVTYDRVTGVGRIYKNGELAVEYNFESFRPRTNSMLYLGQHHDSVGRYNGALDELSLYTKPLSPTEVMALYTAGAAGKAPSTFNVTPTVFLDAPVPSSTIVINTAITLSAIAADTDGTVAKVEFFDGTTKLGETTTADAGQSSRYSYALASGLPLGQHVLSARVTDNAGASANSTASTITVVPILPVVTLTSPAGGATVVQGNPLTLQASATYSAGAIARVEFYDGAAKLGESTAPVSGSTYEYTLPAGLTAGAHGLSARVIAADGGAARSAPVSVTSQIVLPVVSLTSPVNGATLVVGTPQTLKASATTTQGTITKVEFFDGTAKLGERIAPDATGGIVFSFGVQTGFTAGAHSLTAKATTSTGSTATSTPVGVSAGGYTSDPVVKISTPAEDTRISAPVMMTGVVGMEALTSWALDYRLKVADGENPNPWVQFATGTNLVGTPAVGPDENPTTPAIPGDLGKFDPTNLLNGIYEVQIHATNAAHSTLTSPPYTFVVDGNMKVGAFTLAFEDMKIPVAGIPITATRTYDSRDSRVGDFGPGWNLAVADVRVQKNRALGTAWAQTERPVGDTNPNFLHYVLPVNERIVTVTMPDGESHRFRAGLLTKSRPFDPDNSSWNVPAQEGKYRFYPLGDTTSTLEVLDASNQLAEQVWIQGAGENEDIYVGEYGDTGDDLFPVVFNTTRYRLTTKDGTKYILDEKLGLLRLEDLNGNTLVLNRDANNRVTTIVSQRAAPTLGSSLPAPSSITVHRDGTGRVDYIRDPAGHDLDYLYDAQGRLASFTNRENNTTQFKYENAAFPNYLTKIMDPRGVAALRSEYDDNGKLVKQIDADGHETVFTHGVDAATRFEKVKDRLGKETTFFYDDRGNVTTKIDPLGAQTTYSYYPDTDRVKFETDHYGNTKSMAYDARGNVTVETTGASTSSDPANPITGYVTRTSYNAQSAPTQITDPSGRTQTFGYDPVTNNLLTHTVGAGGSAPATTTFHYNADGTLDTVTDALGAVTATTYNYSYSNSAYPGAVKQTTVTVRDASSSILRVSSTLTDAQENMIATIATRTLPQGGTEDIVTRYLYDTENRLKATIMPDGKVSETRYTSFGQTDRSILWQSLADYQSGNLVLGRVTSYGYDNRGNQVVTTYPDGSSESSSFDLEGRREWSQDKLGRRTSFQYDDVGRLRFTILPATSSTNPYTETVYDLTGRVTDSYDELRHRTSVVYFPDGTPDAGRRKQSVQVLSTGNLVTSYQYDASGNVRFVTDPRSNTTETQYDDQGRPTTVVYPATDEHPATQSSTTYDILGRRVATTDQEGKVTRYRYDALGRLVEVRQYLDQSLAASDSAFSLPSSAVGIVATRYTYDELGNQLTQTDARNNTTSYRYDNLGRRTSRILPDNATESLQYDGWGNLWKRTDFKGYTTTFSYDALNRLTAKQADPSHPSLIYSHAPDKITYGYDAAGNRTDATVEKGSTVLYVEDTPRDERDRRQYKETSLGRLTYGYYANSLLKSITSSNTDGVKLAYRYDDANRLAFVDDSAQSQLRTTSYGYNANGSLQSVLYANSVQHAYTYDTLNRLRTLNVTKGATLHSYEYKLRPSGHRQQVIENGTRTTTFAYDELYRLTGETLAGDTHGNSGAITYGLDKVGNRETRTSSVAPVASSTATFNNRDWLAGDTYDANGNTTLSFGIPLPDVYDFEDRLIIRHKVDGSEVDLSYDADGILRQKTVLSPGLSLVSATGYLTDTQNPTGYAQVMEERVNASSGVTVRTYAYGSDLISRTEVASAQVTTRYFSYDGLGSVRELTSETGSVTDQYDYDAFGILTYRFGITDNAYLYRGERYESDIGQYYLRARFYNQATGRFWNQDSNEGSFGDPMSLHKYLYANADPISGLDPTGHFTLVELQEAVVAIGNTARLALPTLRAVYTARYVVGVQLAYSSTFWAVSFGLLSGGSVLADGGGVEDAFVATLLGYYFSGGPVKWSASRSPNARYIPNSAPNPRGGMPVVANYAQKDINAAEEFSETGQKIYSEIANRPIRTVNDLANAIRQGVVKVQDIPVEYVVRPNGNVLIHNTRTAEALTRASIPRANWNAVDCSDVAEVVTRVEEQLQRNNFDDHGTPTLGN